MQTTTALNATGFVTSHPLPIVLWRFSEEKKKVPSILFNAKKKPQNHNIH